MGYITDYELVIDNKTLWDDAEFNKNFNDLNEI